MASSSDTTSMALFCDFENIALASATPNTKNSTSSRCSNACSPRGSIVVKKAYCDWERYKGFKATMHEANFELIEIPRPAVRQELGRHPHGRRCPRSLLHEGARRHLRHHLRRFRLLAAGFKLRENAKQVIGVGVKQSCSDLLVTNCDEFIYYDDLVRDRDAQRSASRREQPAKRTPEEEKKRRDEMEARRLKAVEQAIATFEDLIAVRRRC